MDQEYPSVLQQLQNATKASAKVIAEVSKGKSVFVPEEIENERKQICYACTYYDAQQKRCRQCGCPIHTKIKFRTERCPLNYWESKKTDSAQEEQEEPKEQKEKIILKHTLGPDTPTPPDNPSEGEIYVFKGFRWQFINNEWKFLI